MSLSHKEKVHSQFLHVQKCSFFYFFFFFSGMSLCQVEQRKLPQLRAATSAAVLALCRRIPLDLPALFLRRHNQREKNSTVDCSYCVQGAGAASV